MAKQKSRFPSYGLVRGPSHEQGGVAGMVAGEQPVELEGGEWIIPKEAVPDYLPVLKQITNEGRAMQQMQNGNSAMDALIASATMETGLAQPKSPMFQEGGAVSDNTRVAMNEFIPDISYNLPTFDGKTKERQYSMSNMPMSDEEMMDIAMGMATPGSAIGSLAKKASKIATQRDLLGKFYKDPISGLSKKGMLKLVEEAVPDNTIGVYGEPLSYFKNLKTDELADVLRSAYGLARNPNIVKEKAGVGTAAYLTNMGREGVDFALRDIKDLKIKEQGGMIDEYEGGGQLHSRRMYNQKDKKKYGYQMGGMMPEYQEQGGMIKQYQQGGQTDRGAYPSKDLEMLQEYPTSYKFFMDRRGEKAYYPEQDTLAARMFRGEINPNQAFSKALMLPFEDESRYGGGKQQMQPRKQQEIRNPQMYGPPDSLMGPDTTMGNLDDLLNYYMESDRRNQLNALTGDTIDPQLDSLRLLQRMKKSKMPRTGRKSMQEGGTVMYQQGGQVLGRGQPLSSEYQRTANEFTQYDPNPAGYAPLANQAMPDALLSSIGSDKRIKPLRPDTYIKKMPLSKPFDSSNMNYAIYQQEVEQVPKLSTAYLASFGMETPLSRNQSRLLFRKGISPDTLNPKVKGLINRALIQRLANEED